MSPAMEAYKGAANLINRVQAQRIQAMDMQVSLLESEMKVAAEEAKAAGVARTEKMAVLESQLESAKAGRTQLEKSSKELEKKFKELTTKQSKLIRYGLIGLGALFLGTIFISFRRK